MRPIEQQVILVTGATDGLGRAVATDLAGRGATVLVHGRNDERGRRTVEEIRNRTQNERVSFVRADFSRLAEVQAMARQVGSKQDRLDVLVNNAGIYPDKRHESDDGYELAFQVNYLSHVLLTRLLLPLLERSAPARIVNVASAGQLAIDFDDIMLTRNFSGGVSYQRSKLAQILFTKDLAEEIKKKGITVNALHPGTYMPTKMVVGRFPPANSIEEGMEATVRLAASPDVDGITGKYFSMQKESRADSQAYDVEARRRLRQETDRLLSPYLEKP